MNIDQFIALQAEEKEEQPKQEEAKAEIVTAEKETKQEETKVQTFKVGDEELTIEELQKGYLRQSDYTKKTTEVSKLRKEHEAAVNLFNSIEANPELAKQIKDAGGNVDEASAQSKRIRELEAQIASQELDSMLTSLKSKYSDFDETAVMNEAAKRKTTDLEFVYKAIRDVKGGDDVDREAIKAELLEELKAELNGNIPPTLMDGKAPAKTVTQQEGPVMSKREHSIAEGMGISDEEYIKYRDSK